MTRFEYTTHIFISEEIFSTLPKELNSYGKAGWELCTSCPLADNTYLLIFKRPCL